MSLKDKIDGAKFKDGLVAMPDEAYSRLLEVLRIQSSSGEMYEMQVYVINKLREMLGVSSWFDSDGNIFVQKGNAEYYPCMVAHLDTVHSIKPTYKLYSYKERGQKVLFAKTAEGKETGIGGDDKNGIFANLEMIRRVKNIKAVFFVDEEIGCVGSSNVDHTFFEDVGYLIQLDRWGNSDLINDMWGKTTSDEFDEAIAPAMLKHNYKFATGLMTDSLTLHDDEVGVSAINVSCGYYEHHSVHEKVNSAELWDAITLTHSMIKALGENSYPSYPDTYNSYHKYPHYGYKDDYDGFSIAAKEVDDTPNSTSAVERYMRNQSRDSLNAADIYENLYERLVDWESLSYMEREEVKDDWMFLYGTELSEEEIKAYAESTYDGDSVVENKEIGDTYD